ncbi:MAG: hypothetical protein MJZ67_02535 [Bacteroidales bacterium]|nr:hypothetical protein [Bacteroidales bacterium]
MALQMASSSATTFVEVLAPESISNYGIALFSATVAAPNLWLAGIKVNGQVVKPLAAFGGGGDDEE